MCFGFVITTKKKLNDRVKDTFKIWSKFSQGYLVEHQYEDEYEVKYHYEVLKSSHGGTVFTYERARKLCLEHKKIVDTHRLPDAIKNLYWTPIKHRVQLFGDWLGIGNFRRNRVGFQQ